MKNNNIMILNNKNIGVSKIEFNPNGNLIITDKTGKYCLVVCIQYNIEDINNIRVGEDKKIDFNEYYICENNEPALIIPTSSSIQRLNNDILCFHFNFENIENDIHYMNKKEHFDIELKSLKCDIEINYNKVSKGI